MYGRLFKYECNAYAWLLMSYISHKLDLAPHGHLRSVREVEVIVGVVIVLALTEAGESEVDRSGNERNTTPDLDTVVDDISLEEESVGTAVHEVEEPLLGSIRSVMPDVASSVGALLIEVLFSVPGAVLHLGDAETLAVNKSHVLGVAKLVVSKTAALGVHIVK